MYLSVVLLVCLPLLCVLQYGRMAVPNTGGKAKNQSINQSISQSKSMKLYRGYLRRHVGVTYIGAKISIAFMVHILLLDTNIFSKQHL